MTPDEAIQFVREIPEKPRRRRPRALLGIVARRLGKAIRENFANASGPDGSPWPPASRKDDDGHPPRRYGFLKAAALGLRPGGFDDLSAKEMTIGIDKFGRSRRHPGAQRTTEGTCQRISRSGIFRAER